MSRHVFLRAAGTYPGPPTSAYEEPQGQQVLSSPPFSSPTTVPNEVSQPIELEVQRPRMDNEPTFIGRLAEQWSEANGIIFKCIEPDKPMQHAYIERVNKAYLDGILTARLFDNLELVRDVITTWLEDNSAVRPHNAIYRLLLHTYR